MIYRTLYQIAVFSRNCEEKTKTHTDTHKDKNRMNKEINAGENGKIGKRGSRTKDGNRIIGN